MLDAAHSSFSASNQERMRRKRRRRRMLLFSPEGFLRCRDELKLFVCVVMKIHSFVMYEGLLLHKEK